MKVLHDRVVLKPVEAEAKSAGGIVLHSAAVEPTFEAVVISVGTGRPVKDAPPIPLEVKVGDRVLYNPSAATGVKVNGEDILVIKEDEIYAVLN